MSKAKLINPKIIFSLFILVQTCYEVLNLVDEPIFGTNLFGLCVHFLAVLLIVFIFPILLILAILHTEKESNNNPEKPEDKSQFSLFDIGPFLLGGGSVSLLSNTYLMGFPLYQITLFLALAIVVILITNAVRGGAKLL